MGCEASQTMNDANEKYAIIKEINNNNDYCKIYEGRNKKTGEEIIIKEVDKILLFQNKSNEVQTEIKELLIKEMNSMNLLKDCENMIKLKDYYETDDKYVIILEKCDEDLYSYLKKNKSGIRKDEIFIIFNGINKCLKKMNELKIIHKDLRPQNILLKYDKTQDELIPKIGSLGLIHDIELINSDSSKTNLMNQKSLIPYIAPELLDSGDYKNITIKSNLWSLGIILYQLAFDNFPFGDNLTQLKLKYKKDLKIEKTGDKDLDDLISKLLIKHPFERIEFDEYLNHAFWIEKDESIPNLNKFNEKYNTHIKLEDNKINIENINIGDEGFVILGKIKFKELTELRLSVLYQNTKNCITNIKPIISDKYKDLLELDLSYNNITNLNLLCNSSFTKLKELSLSNNHISDINFLKELPFDNLLILNLNENEIKDISILEFVNFNNLERLNLESNKIEDISVIRQVPFRKIKYLNLSKNIIKDFSEFSHPPFNTLEELYLSENNIDDISFLKQITLTHLKVLYLDRNKIDYIDILSHINCENLQELNLSYNQIDSIRAFNNIQFANSLQDLDLSHNVLTDVQILKRNQFKNLKNLYLGKNNLDYESKLNVGLFDILLNKGVNLQLEAFD